MKKTILLITLFISYFSLTAQNQDVVKMKEQVNLKFKDYVHSYIKFNICNTKKDVILLRLDSIYPKKQITTKLYFYNEITKKTIKVSPLIKIQNLYSKGYDDFELEYDDIHDNLIIIGKD